MDILLFIVDYSPSLVREYMMQQINSTDDDGLLMNIVIEGMICDTGGSWRWVIYNRGQSCATLLRR